MPFSEMTHHKRSLHIQIIQLIFKQDKKTKIFGYNLLKNIKELTCRTY